MDQMKCPACGSDQVSVTCQENHEHGQTCTMKCNACGAEAPAPAPQEEPKQ